MQRSRFLKSDARFGGPQSRANVMAVSLFTRGESELSDLLAKRLSIGMSPERAACIQMTPEYDRISQSFNSMTFFFISKQLCDFQLINLDSH